MRLPFTFIFTGIAGFILFHVLSISTMAGWIGEIPRSPDGWFRVHLLILGWATMTAMGAIYQLISVVLQSNIYSERLGFIHYGLFLVGLLGLLYGFHQGQASWIAVFAVITFASFLCFAWNLFRTLWKVSQWNPITISVTCAIVYLLLTGLFGLAMGINFAYGGLSDWHDRFFAVHIWLGTLGWFGLLIIGFSYKLLPMFYLSHGQSVRQQYGILWLWNAGLLIGVVAFLCDSAPGWKGLGILLVAASAVIYNVHIAQIRKLRHKKTPGVGIKWARFCALLLAVTGIVMSVVVFVFADVAFQQKTIVLLGWAYLWGFVAMTILGYLSKIAPFLWWTHKYGPRVGKEKVPAMGDLISERWANIGLMCIIVALFGLMLGIGFELMTVIRIAGSLLSLFSLVYMALIARVFTQ